MDAFWALCLRHFEQSLPQQQFRTWIQPLRPRRNGKGLILEAPNRFVLQWVKDRFLPVIEQLARDHQGASAIQIELGARAEQSADPAQQPAAPARAPASPSAALEPKPRVREVSRLNPAFTFDSFVAGKANQLARAAALQVAEHPGTAYNPLFIYGGVGLGKTHLLQAIGNLVQELDPQAKIRYIHAEQYVSDVVRAYQHKAFDGFKKYYHSLDLLLIDDIQFFGGKNRTQEEFFYAFNALIESHKQVIITCDTYPKEISGMEDRLISRFGWGLTVAIEPPELEMRVAILLKKAEADAVALPQDVAFFIAKHIQSNVRELEGALKRVIAYSRFAGQLLSVELAREALKDLLAIQYRQVSVDNIQRTVADYYKIKVSEMYSKKRSRNVARPRQIAMALAKELTQLSLPDIGEAFGGRDHTTVLHACRKIAELKSQSPEIGRDFDALLQVLRS
jgi:chromosomal replication initiator protein